MAGDSATGIREVSDLLRAVQQRLYELTVDLDLVDAHRDGMRIGGRGLIDDALRIEQNEIA